MDLLAELLSTLLAGLSLLLMGIALTAASRYSDVRLGFVAGALGVFAAVGLLSLLHQISPRYGGGFGVDPIPLALAVLAVALLYLALVRPRPGSTAESHG